MNCSTIRVIDSHTGGEPTRVVISGAPTLPGRGAAETRTALTGEYDWFRRAVVHEPRGHDVLVGALPVEAADPTAVTAVVFFNKVGCLGMCGHGTIGLITTLAHLKTVDVGKHRIETPVGLVDTELHESGQVSVRNVASYRAAKNVPVEVEGIGVVRGDIAWGGNWFFLVEDHGQTIDYANVDNLLRFAKSIQRALDETVRTPDGGLIDHVELFGPSDTPGVDSRSFVLCPGGVFDRSPCGTGTSAKLACLYSDGKLADGQVWRQESVIGSVFEGRIDVDGDLLIPTITGRAFVTGDNTLIFDSDDPFAGGIER